MTLPYYIECIIAKLEGCGFEAFAVGGAVRDCLLGRTPDDWDVATSALPADILQIFGEKNCIPTGIKHGTITVLKDRHAVEVTTYRIDGEYIDFRHPESVRFSQNIADDLSRRDFSVNAMAYNTKSGLIDPYGGRKDLKNGIIRAVGDPHKRFEEDALRIVRGLRFAATLGFEIEEQTRDAIHCLKGLLSNIARERLQSELSKLIPADNPKDIMIEFADVFAEIFDLGENFCAEQWICNAKLLCSAPPKTELRLAILLDGICADILPYQLLQRLKYDNRTIGTVKTISKYMYADIAPDPICIKYIMSDIGEDMLRLVLETNYVKFEDSSIKYTEDILNKIVDRNECYLQKDLKIDGHDLIKLGFSGTEIGVVLKHLLSLVIEEKCKNEEVALVEQAKTLKGQLH